MPDDATAKSAEQARAFLTWAEQEIHDGVFLPGALRELKERVARILYALAQRAADCPSDGGDAAARLWRFFSTVDPRQQPVGHRRFVESFRDGEPTEMTLRALWHAECVSAGLPKKMVDSRLWKLAVERRFGGRRAAAAELLQAVRRIAAWHEAGTGSATALPVEHPRAGAAYMRAIENDPEAQAALHRAQAGQLARGGNGPASKPTHSPDFTSVDWFGTRYTFAKGNQAESICMLWAAWEGGGHSLSQETIGERIGSAARHFELAKTFRRKKPGGYEPHPAWGTMIQQDSKGSYRLAPPESA